MRRVTFRNGRGHTLVADLTEGGTDKVVVLAHGFTGDRSSRGRFGRAAERLRRIGWSALAFDFAGCGESDADVLTMSGHRDDLTAAVAFARSLSYQRVALWGHSLGSRVCVEARLPDIATMILTGAALGPMQYTWSEHYSPEQLDELSRTGVLRVNREGGGDCVVAAEMLHAFSSYDSGAVRALRSPVLVIHGDGDEEERQLLKQSRDALRRLPDGSRLLVLYGADHSLLQRYDDVLDAAAEWLPQFV